jgi:DNA-binding protein H-NS
MATTIVIDKTNMIEGLKKILELLTKWFELEVKIKKQEITEKEDLTEYEEFMKQIEEDMKKEGIKFEKLSFEEWRKTFLNNKKKIEKIVSKIMS